jgi:hypothetical protein
VTRKTIHFKLPVLATDAAPSALDPSEVGAWVMDPEDAARGDAIEAFAFAGPTQADNDQAIEAAKPELFDEVGSAFTAAPPRREAAQTVLRGFGPATNYGLALARGLNALSREWLTLPFDAAQRGLDGLDLLRCRTLSDLMGLQADMACRTIDGALARSGRITQISIRMIAESSSAFAIGSPGGREP